MILQNKCCNKAETNFQMDSFSYMILYLIFNYYQMNIFIGIASLIVFVYFYFIMAFFFSHRRFNYLQETSVAILIGLVVGLIVSLKTDFFVNTQVSNYESIRNIIFLVLLPPIMFQDGYNFPKRKFVQNIFYVNLYGLLGTIVNFVFVWGFLTLVNNYGLIVSVSNKNETIQLFNWQILLMSAAFCSIEPIVTEKIVDKDKFPKLFSIMLGESLFKDTISITLFDTIKQMVEDGKDMNYDIIGSDVGLLILKFLQVVLCSILIGFLTGILTTIVFKNLRFLVKEEGSAQTALTLLTGYVAYIISEALSFSGVISMLFCGTILSHYNVYNLTELGSNSTKVAVDALKMAATGLIFFFIGFQIFNIQSFESSIDSKTNSSLSLSLLGFTILALLLGRALNTYLMSLIGYWIIGKEKWKLNIYEYFILFLMGLIHGAVPFALSVTLPFPTTSSSNCIQLNIVFIVVVSCLIYHIFVPKLIRMMVKKIRELQRDNRYHPSVKDSFMQNQQNLRFQSKKTVINNDIQTPFLKKLKSTTQKYWKKLQNGFFKPHLIFDYHQRKAQIKMDKILKRKQEHDEYEKRFNKDNQNILDADNQDDNQFFQVVHSNKQSSSDYEDDNIVVIKGEKKVKQTKKKHKKNAKQQVKKQTEIFNLNVKTPKKSSDSKIQSSSSEKQSDKQGLKNQNRYSPPKQKTQQLILTIQQNPK